MGALERVLPPRLRTGLLRDGAVPRRRPAYGHRPVRVRSVQSITAASRPDHSCRAGVDQDGADHSEALRPDARAEVGDLDGRLLQLDGGVQQLRARAGRQVHADRRACPRLSATPGVADARRVEAAQDDSGRSRHGLARSLRRPRHGGDRRAGPDGRGAGPPPDHPPPWIHRRRAGKAGLRGKAQCW